MNQISVLIQSSTGHLFCDCPSQILLHAKATDRSVSAQNLNFLLYTKSKRHFLVLKLHARYITKLSTKSTTTSAPAQITAMNKSFIPAGAFKHLPSSFSFRKEDTKVPDPDKQSKSKQMDKPKAKSEAKVNDGAPSKDVQCKTCGKVHAPGDVGMGSLGVMAGGGTLGAGSTGACQMCHGPINRPAFNQLFAARQYRGFQPSPFIGRPTIRDILELRRLGLI